MKPRLQNFDHRSSHYERPNQSWVCGRASSGKPCALGPDGVGQCRTLSECRPRRSGDNWACTRSKSAGGACHDGPSSDGRCCRELPPCLPVRSLRSRRGRFTAWVTVACLGLILLLFGSRMSTDLVDAGTLYTGHAEIEACADCHVAFNSGPVGWVRAAFAAANPIADSDKCLACHKWGGNALNPHNVSRPELADLTSKFFDRPEAANAPWTVQVSRVFFPVPSETHNGTLACGACHKEHEGEDADLLEVTNARCQSCHEMAFESFSDGHPSFGDYPYLQRTQLIFDHDSHNRKNFPEKVKQGVKPPETCDSCHMPDGTGRFMLTANFEETCGLCHGEDIIGETVAGPKGTPIIAVPELDLLTLQERNVAIGEWPDTPLAIDISPYTKLLIAADSVVADDLLVIEDVDLQDLSDASDTEIQAVGRVAWAIKELLFDLTIAGMEILEAKVEASLDRALDTDTLGRLVGHIPQDVVAAAGEAWFPSLKQEVVAYRAVKPASLSVPATQGQAADDTLSEEAALDGAAATGAGGIVLAQASTIQVEELPNNEAAENEALGLPTLDPEEWAKAGGWYRKDFILYYRPVGHEDVVLRTWLDISARSFGTPAERYGDALFALLADKNTPGKCTKCHSVDQQQGGGLEVNWAPFQPLVGETKFTTFVHSTHFSSVGDDGCITCHQLNEDTQYQESYKGRDPHEFVSNFAPMKREICADCHVEKSAGDTCMMCHEYHIGEFATESMPDTRFDELDKEKPAGATEELEGARNGTDAPSAHDSVVGSVADSILSAIGMGKDEPAPATPPELGELAVPILDFDPRTGAVNQGGSDVLPGLLSDLLDQTQASSHAEQSGTGGPEIKQPLSEVDQPTQ